jgi:hypothetical protein
MRPHVIVLAAALGFASAGTVSAQSRGVYPLGMSATSSGVTPAPGFTYANQLLVYSRDRATGENGDTIATGSNAVVMDMNTFTWVSRRTWLGGARYSASATVPIARNNLSSDLSGTINDAAGLADSFYLPLIVGWKTERTDLRVLYGFLAPTGRFTPGADDNVGSGYWTHTVSSGQTVSLTTGKRFLLSAYEMYEWHTTQEGTGTQPGDTVSVDYSLMAVLPMRDDAWRLHVGFAGYEQYQTTAKTGPSVSATASRDRYVIHAIGLAVNAAIPGRGITLGVKCFEELNTRSTFEGYSLQVSAAFAF